MSPEACNRVRDALAAGNVFGDAALLEHAKDCQVCKDEIARLKERRDFRDAFPRLSSIADQSKPPPSRAGTSPREARLRASRRHLLIMMATVVAIVMFFIRSRTRLEPSRDETSAMGPPRYRISNLESALFDSKVDGTTVRSSMTRGMAAFHVEQMGPHQRFLLTLPDGELEVRGTRFVVTVADGKTKGVDVAEGTVALRLRGRAEMLLSEGERWPADGSGRPNWMFINLAPKDAAAPEPPKSGD
jgi:ferric-dicitrate binding protein FerR (iron transport regulator)